MSKSKSLPILVGGAMAAAFLAAAPPQALAGAFTLGDFTFYGLLVNNGVTGGDINTPPVNANIGIGNVTGPINLHNEVVNGEVDCSGSCASAVSGGAITGTQLRQGALFPAGHPASVNSNVAAVESAITTANNLSTTYGAESGSGTAVTLTGSATINASSGFLDVTGARVFTAPVFSPGNGHTITINGTSSDFVVIDVTGNGGSSLNGALTLTGGISSDQVLINFTGTSGSVQGAANGATLEGTFLIRNEAVTLNSLTIDGRLFGGDTANFQFVSNAFILQPVPAPLIGHGLFVLAAVGGVLFGGKLLESLKKRRSLETAA
jgi:hypothetical protein